MDWWVWLIIAGAIVILEIFTQGFLVFWFAVGALAAGIVSIFTSNIFIQFLVFGVTSTILLFFTKSFSEKMRTKEDVTKFNIDTVIGKVGTVEKEVSKLDFGVVKIGGSTWTAVTTGDTIEVGEQVIVKEIDGVKVVVERQTEL